MERAERFKKIIAWFQQNMPEPKTELIYSNHYELLVAVILSAQCTDKRVNQVTPTLFNCYPTAYHLAKAEPGEVFEKVRSCSYPNSKSKNLVGMARMLVQEFNGVVPCDAELLQRMPGVGRKTANVILSVAFNKPAMAVDTHVFRVSNRLGLTIGAKTPLHAEKQLVEYIPKELLSTAHHWLILHGRYVCSARNPKCNSCGLSTICNYYSKTKNTNRE